MAKSKAWCDIKDITGKTRFLFPFSFRDKTNDNTVFPPIFRGKTINASGLPAICLGVYPFSRRGVTLGSHDPHSLAGLSGLSAVLGTR